MRALLVDCPVCASELAPRLRHQCLACGGAGVVEMRQLELEGAQEPQETAQERLEPSEGLGTHPAPGRVRR